MTKWAHIAVGLSWFGTIVGVIVGDRQHRDDDRYRVIYMTIGGIIGSTIGYVTGAILKICANQFDIEK